MNLKASKRELLGKKVKHMRKEGKVPASVFGPNRKESTNLTLDPLAFRKVFAKIGYSKLFDLEIEGEKKTKALVKEVQLNNLTQQLLHVSIYEVDMHNELQAEIPVHIEGSAPAVKNNFGLLVTPVTHIKVTCLPENLPADFVINVDGFEQIGDSIHLSDVAMPEGVELAYDMKPEMVLAAIAAPQKSIEEETAEEEAAAEAAAEAAGEIAEEPAEGEEAAGAAGDTKEAASKE